MVPRLRAEAGTPRANGGDVVLAGSRKLSERHPQRPLVLEQSEVTGGEQVRHFVHTTTELDVRQEDGRAPGQLLVISESLGDLQGFLTDPPFAGEIPRVGVVAEHPLSQAGPLPLDHHACGLSPRIADRKV